MGMHNSKPQSNPQVALNLFAFLNGENVYALGGVKHKIDADDETALQILQQAVPRDALGAYPPGRMPPMNAPQEHRQNPQHGPGPDELASDAFEFQRMQEAHPGPPDHAAAIVALADSARIHDDELVD